MSPVICWVPLGRRGARKQRCHQIPPQNIQTVCSLSPYLLSGGILGAVAPPPDFSVSVDL